LYVLLQKEISTGRGAGVTTLTGNGLCRSRAAISSVLI